MEPRPGVLGRAYLGLCGFSWLRLRDGTRVICSRPLAGHGDQHEFEQAWCTVGLESEVAGAEWLP